MSFNNQNYFQLFSLPETFALDLDQLNLAYRNLQSQVHPDRFASGTEAERLQALQRASVLNQAHTTLSSPLLRAEYLLQCQGINTHKTDQSDLSPGLLMEQIQWREALEDIPRDESSLGRLEKLSQEVEARLRQEEQGFADAFASHTLTEARRHFHALQYLYKLRSEIAAVEEDLLGY